MSGIPKKITYRPIPFRMVMIKSGKRLRNDAAAGAGKVKKNGRKKTTKRASKKNHRHGDEQFIPMSVVLLLNVRLQNKNILRAMTEFICPTIAFPISLPRRFSPPIMRH